MERPMTELVAIGDQIQELIMRSGMPILGFVILTEDVAEYRSPLPLEDFKAQLILAAEVL